MATPITKVKLLISDTFHPGGLVPADGTTLEEQINTFLATVPNANVLDVGFMNFRNGKYGMYSAYVLYKV